MHPRLLLPSVAVLAAAVLAGCMPASAETPRPAPSTPAAVEPVALPPVVTVDVAEGATIEHGRPVTVTSRRGVIEVARLSTGGSQVPVDAPTGDTWTAPALLPSTSYTLTAVAIGSDGQRTAAHRTFSTGAPERELTTDVVPWGDQVVGIGHPLTVTLSAPVEDAEGRAAVESALTVSADREIGEASWSWISDTVLQFRPRDFWPAHTRVTLDVNLDGVKAGDGLWGVRDRQVTFRTGRALTVTIDAETHSAKVVRDGEVVRTMDVSLGKPGQTTATRSGTKVVMTRHESYRMRSSTLGDSYDGDSYDLVVPYAMRLTWSGEFLHGADYNQNIGRANTSHGCTNLRSEDARWLYENVLVGDPVVTTGTDRWMEEGNGLGGPWNVDWETWTSRSAA